MKFLELQIAPLWKIGLALGFLFAATYAYAAPLPPPAESVWEVHAAAKVVDSDLVPDILCRVLSSRADAAHCALEKISKEDRPRPNEFPTVAGKITVRESSE